ncbi:MAG: hypothetical protein CVT78_00135 [Alphaproteobacteria bacterium HGW-Alphaproteobacteria-17]|nr:MAG: hypothetical protein CVT78_00135 [Alphaproteobacteria bacterium HGW-Alphaproteobacteria-17]
MNNSDMLRRLGNEQRPVRFLFSRLLARTGLAERFGLKIRRQGYKLHFFNTALSMNLWLYANGRSEDVEIVRALLKPGGTYVDIGANIGDLVLAGATAVGDQGCVYAFEAHPKIFALMTRNVALNARANVHPVNAACGEDFGWARFSDMRSDDLNQIGSGEIVVPMLPAQHLLPDGQIDLIKVDVEGFELFVLKGLTEAFERTQSLFLEVGDAHFTQFGYRYSDIHELLTAHGFTIFAKSAGEGPWNVVASGDHPFPTVQNIIASRDIAVRARLA